LPDHFGKRLCTPALGYALFEYHPETAMTLIFKRSLPVAMLCACLALWCAATPSQAASEAPLSYQQAKKALKDADPERRVQAMSRLLQLGKAPDARWVYPLLADTDPSVREVALSTVWQLWGRSGDADVDRLYQQGVDAMNAQELAEAQDIFSKIIAKRPQFAEGWNKRATVYYMAGQYERSIKDCEEVLKRVPQHFGALVGYSQMLAQQGRPERALELMERAVKVNPYVSNAEFMMEALKQQIENKRKNTV
jgi:tetratricopeptide (TPR) repeat protein